MSYFLRFFALKYQKVAYFDNYRNNDFCSCPLPRRGGRGVGNDSRTCPPQSPVATAPPWEAPYDPNGGRPLAPSRGGGVGGWATISEHAHLSRLWRQLLLGRSLTTPMGGGLLPPPEEGGRGVGNDSRTCPPQSPVATAPPWEEPCDPIGGEALFNATKKAHHEVRFFCFDYSSAKYLIVRTI